MANSHSAVIADNFAQFKAAWDAGAAASIGSVGDPPAVLTEDTEAPGQGVQPPTISDPSGGTRKLAQNEPYARYRARHTAGGNAAIGRKLFRHEGQIVVQVFHPRLGGVGKAKALALANVALQAYQGASSGTVFYVRAALREVGASGPWYQVNVTVDFYWFERKG
jgi:hypothetical protein